MVSGAAKAYHIVPRISINGKRARRSFARTVGELIFWIKCNLEMNHFGEVFIISAYGISFHINSYKYKAELISKS